ncbi:hypothetical protein ONZ45_g14467 [Pleurotus djamor]|nr:hypothetical protein ONZ45_g14467 [Pleurotus djamor]
MLHTASLLVAVFFAVCAAATPSVSIRDSPITLPLARKTNFTRSINLVKADQARARALWARAEAKATGNPSLLHNTVINEQISNQYVAYAASVYVGNPSRTFDLLIDTGSSNTWVKGERYVRSTTSRKTNDTVAVRYGSGYFSGDEFIDRVSFGNGLDIPQQSIGVAKRSDGLSGFDGILGIGPVQLTYATLFPHNTSLIPTVTDNLFSNGVIPQNLIGIYFKPTTTVADMDGGIDGSKTTGPVHFTNITSERPSSSFWGVNQSIRYGSDTTILSSGAGIVDTGTTLILIASDAFKRYTEAIGAALDDKTGLLRITSTQFAKICSLFFIIDGISYELTPNAQIWPRALNTAIGGDPDHIYLIVADLGSLSGIDFINGYTFLQRYYTVYDTTNRRVGFATTPNTFATSN